MSDDVLEFGVQAAGLGVGAGGLVEADPEGDDDDLGRGPVVQDGGDEVDVAGAELGGGDVVGGVVVVGAEVDDGDVCGGMGGEVPVGDVVGIY